MLISVFSSSSARLGTCPRCWAHFCIAAIISSLLTFAPVKASWHRLGPCRPGLVARVEKLPPVTFLGSHGQRNSHAFNLVFSLRFFSVFDPSQIIVPVTIALREIYPLWRMVKG